MADKVPVKGGYNGGSLTGLAEYATGDTLGVAHGGTGLAAVGANQLLTGHNSSTTGALTSESNLTFDGSTLGVAGAVTITKNNDYGVSTYDGTNAGGTIGLGTLSDDANGGWLLKNVYYNGSAWAVNNSSVGAGAMKFDGSGNIIWLTQASGSGLPAERMRILAGGGLTFNGDTAAANALDDYEEGTWTPVWKFGGASGTVNTQTENAAWYTKIGNMVTVWYRGALSGNPSGSGALVITGLPYTIKNTSNQYIGTGAWSNLIAFGDGIAVDANFNSTFVNVQKYFRQQAQMLRM